MPKVSIIIPVYNVEEFIEKALNSVINQTLKDIEIICVNDCTPDKSFEIVKKYAKNDERFILLEQETNQGQGVARNRALDIATGDYIMFLDPDDWYELDACEKAYNQISKNKNEIVFFNIKYHLYKKNKIFKTKIAKNRLKKFEKIKQNSHINLSEFNENWLTASYTVAQIYSRNFLNIHNIRYSSERFTEDIPFFIKAIVYSEDISVLDEPIYNALRKLDKLTLNYFNYYEDVLSAKEKAREIILNSGKKEKFWINYLIYETRSNFIQMQKFCSNNLRARKEFYPKIRKNLQKNIEEIPIEFLKISYEYLYYKLILKSKTYEEYITRKFFVKLFKFMEILWKKLR